MTILCVVREMALVGEAPLNRGRLQLTELTLACR